MEHAVLRKIEKSEAKDVSFLENECFSSPWPFQEIEYELSENPCSMLLGIYEREKLVAYLDFMITFDSATINRICVSKSERKKGYASLLLKKMEEICKSQEEKVEFITLEVRKSNLPAISLYKKEGYDEITTKKMYYDDGEDAIYMMRSLL